MGLSELDAMRKGWEVEQARLESQLARMALNRRDLDHQFEKTLEALLVFERNLATNVVHYSRAS